MQEHFQWLGLKVQDVVTTCTGVVTCISFDLYGRVQALVEPQWDEKAATVREGCWFDVRRLRLESLAARPVMPVPSSFPVVSRGHPSPRVVAPPEPPEITCSGSY